MEAILETRHVGIAFGSHKAVNDVTFAVRQNELTSIIGPNGAGKTTLFNLLSGQLSATTGQIYFKGNDITKLSTMERTRRGIGRSFQITNVFPNLTVLENVRLSVQSQQKVRYSMFKAASSYKGFEEKALALLDLTLLHNKELTLARNLSHGDKRKLELAMILALKPSVLLLDEPTAGMSIEDVPIIYEVIRKIKDEGDKTILLIEHKMDMIINLSERVMVLFNGSLLADGTPKEIMENETVQTAYLGGLYDGNTA